MEEQGEKQDASENSCPSHHSRRPAQGVFGADICEFGNFVHEYRYVASGATATEVFLATARRNLGSNFERWPGPRPVELAGCSKVPGANELKLRPNIIPNILW
jgi:hypothetical protein